MAETVLRTYQLHYFLEDSDDHAMNAQIHNECEKSFIQAILSMNKYFEHPINIKVEAEEEGGVKNRYIILIGILICNGDKVATLLDSVNRNFFQPNTEISADVGNRLDNVLTIKEAMASESPLTEDEYDYIAKNDKDLLKLKSEYYKTANKDKEIVQIEIEQYDKESPDNPTTPLGCIRYDDFKLCITNKEETSDTTDADARIYIIAPVLIRGRKDYWKGLLNGETIDFKVTDREFLDQVYDHNIKFSNGTYIDCKLRITTTTEVNTNAKKFLREVYSVSCINDDNQFSYTVKRKRKQSSLSSLPELPFPNS